jgi:arylsulfatase A-like enzyme
MNQRPFPLRVALLAVLYLLSLGPTPEGAAAGVRYGDKPNVLFIAIDDLNHWVGYLGRNKQTATPNIDRLARRGVRFTHAYCAAPSCTPSRSALLSGSRPGTTGIYDNYNNWNAIIRYEQCLPAQLRAGGYETLASGKIYHGGVGRKNQWDESLDSHDDNNNPNHPSGVTPKIIGDSDGVNGIKFAPVSNPDNELRDWQTVDFCIKQLEKSHDKPFFLACGLYKPHMPWNVPKKYYDMFPLDKIELPPFLASDLEDVPPAGVKMARPNGDHAKIVASGRWKDAVQGYLAAVAYTDMNVGRLIDAFDKSPHKGNTIIVLWGDHGWHLGEKSHWRKFALWEEATRVPHLWVVPGLTKPDSVCTRPVDLMSVYPTLLDVCGLKTPPHVQGVSIKPLLAEPQAEWTTPAVTTYLHNNHAVRTEGWRYIRYDDGGEELYDETADPYEYVNLASKPEQVARKAEMAKWLPKKNVPDPGKKAGRNAGDNE